MLEVSSYKYLDKPNYGKLKLILQLILLEDYKVYPQKHVLCQDQDFKQVAESNIEEITKEEAAFLLSEEIKDGETKK